MTVISPTSIFRLRPDVFIKAAPDRLHIQHRDSHFVVRASAPMVDTFIEYLDAHDGKTTFAEVESLFPEDRRAALAKLFAFLLGKKAIVRMSPWHEDTELAEAEEVITYMCEYLDDAPAVLKDLLQRRILVCAGGYTLLSIVKTLARMGLRRLWVAMTPGDTRFDCVEISSAFTNTACWKDSDIIFLDQSKLGDAPFDWIIDCNGVKDRLACSERLLAYIWDDSVILGHAEDHAELGAERDDGELSIGDELVVGAVVALACFDHACGIHPLRRNDYAYYPLRENDTLRIAPLRKLVGIGAEGASAVAIAPDDFVDAWKEPLFPLKNLRETTPSDSYIKLYECELVAPGAKTPVRMAAAGFTRQQCLQNLLGELAHLGLSFDQPRDSLPDPAELPDAATDVPIEPVDRFTPREMYIATCLSAMCACSLTLREQNLSCQTGEWLYEAVAGEFAIRQVSGRRLLGGEFESLLLRCYAELCIGVSALSAMGLTGSPAEASAKNAEYAS